MSLNRMHEILKKGYFLHFYNINRSEKKIKNELLFDWCIVRNNY